MPRPFAPVRAGLALALLLAAAPFGAPARADAPGGNGASPVAMLQKVLQSVVNIATWRIEHDPSGAVKWRREFGSGFIIDSAGVIVTNRHVVDGAAIVAVTFADGHEAVASIMALGGALDLALLRVDADRTLPVLHFGDSGKLRIGDPVFTIGNPLGVGISVAAGIVSALDRNLRMSPYDALIQTDAAINHGDSGGPMVDLAGEVVGVDTALVSPTRGFAGLGFAIPANDVAFVVGRLRKYGAIRAGWIGVDLQNLTARLADALGVARPTGAVVVGTDPNQPASLAGLQPGDVITEVDGEAMDSASDVLRRIGRTEPGSEVEISLTRGGAARQVSVPVAVYPGDLKANTAPPESATLAAIADNPNFGITLGAITPEAREKYELTVASGALVTSVDPDSAGGAAGLVPGDVIVRVDGMPIADAADFQRAAARARGNGRYFVALLVQKKDERKWVPVLARAPKVPK